MFFLGGIIIIKIAICDDEEIFCEDLERKLIVIFDDFNIKIDVDCFFTGEGFLKALDKEGIDNYDLVFLDIHLGGISGIDVGRKIREKESLFSNKIIFISCDNTTTRNFVNIEPFGFVEKPFEPSDIKNSVVRFLKKYNATNDAFSYRFNKISYRVIVKDILYFESQDKKIIIHKVNNEIEEFYGKISDLEQELNKRRFIRVNKSFMLNMNYISIARFDLITLVTGEEFTIGRKNRDIVARRIKDFNLGGW